MLFSRKKIRSRLGLWAQWLLLLAGCTQFAGYVFDNKSLRGLGFAYCIGPRPTVFSTIEGVEGFDTRHTLLYTDSMGQRDSLQLDQAFFSDFPAHYFLKNAYSIFFAYPHMFKAGLVDDAMKHAFCELKLPGLRNRLTVCKDPVLRTQRVMKGTPEVIHHRPNCIP
jgi:hypothetical protein